MNAPVVPAVDPIPLPAPVWLLDFLLLFTFLLHVVPMSVTLGGGFWAVVASARRRDPADRDLSARLSKWLPYWTAAAITTGVAALLFLQVLYGPVFYAASVVMAWPWLSIVGLLLVAYYGSYFRAARIERSPGLAFWVGLAAWISFAAIAFVYVNQMTLMLHPERHLPAYLASARGLHLHLAEETLWPRYLHMVAGAVAVAALWVAGLGALSFRRGEREAARRALAFGAKGFAGATLVQLAVGVWLLVSQPSRVAQRLLGESPLSAGALVASVVLALSAARILWRAPAGDRPGRAVVTASVHVAAVLILMLLVRDVVRRETLGRALDLTAIPTAPQWGIIALFAVLLVAGLGTIAWMLLAVRRGRVEEPG